MNKMIPVVKPYLPDEKHYQKYVSKIFNSGWLTNSGPLHQEFENRLKNFLGVESVILVSNCTLGLQLSYKALNLTGNVITTPFSFVATASSLAWEGLQPNFCDIDSESLNINPLNIEKAINEETSAILGVHVYGNPCDVNSIQEIASDNNIKVIYDAAHAFGVKINEKSVLNYGDISILSFHATKALHSIEGGAIIVNDKNLESKIRSMINFGISKEGEITEVGINAKMNEFQAAMGLCLLDDFDTILKNRTYIHNYYMNTLGNKFRYQAWDDDISKNYSYFPVLFNTEDELLKAVDKLKLDNIFPRRYFYPSLSSLSIYGDNSKNYAIAEDFSSRILCLPIYPSLKESDIDRVCKVLMSI